MVEFELLTLSIGVGLVISLLLTEAYGLTVGGMVVPGYVALHAARPLDVALTLAAAWVTFTGVRLLSERVILYGRRRTTLTLLVGFVVGRMLEGWIGPGLTTLSTGGAAALEVEAIGYVIPGLIAIWIDRQGVVETTSGLLVSAALTRLVLVALWPDEVARVSGPPHLPGWSAAGRG